MKYWEAYCIIFTNNLLKFLIVVLPEFLYAQIRFKC